MFEEEKGSKEPVVEEEMKKACSKFLLVFIVKETESMQGITPSSYLLKPSKLAFMEELHCSVLIH